MVNPNERRRWYQVKNAAAESDGAPEVLIYGEIDSYFGVAAADLVRELAAIDAPAITVRINSPGGDVFDGVAILNALRGHSAKVTVVVDGLAASAASVIAMGGDEIVMNENSQMMLHNAWALCIGDVGDMTKTAEMLGRQNTNIASIYADRAGGTVEDWLAVMDEETWLTAQEAVDVGLADLVLVETVKNSTVTAAAAFDLSKFKYPGRQAAPAPRIAARAKTPQPVEAEEPQGKEPTVASLSESALQKLGLDADADDAAIDKAIGDLADAAEKEPDTDTDTEPTAEQVTVAAAKFGLQVLDQTAYNQLVSQAREGAEARAQQISEQDNNTIRAALQTGQITPASEKQWRESLASNRDGTKALLATLPKNTAVPVDPIGHGVDNENAAVDAEMATSYAKVTGRTFGKEA